MGVPARNARVCRTYMFFSHTIKAQPYNMPLLDAMLARRVSMVDYECITEGGRRGGKRTVAFGRYVARRRGVGCRSVVCMTYFRSLT